MFIEQRLWTPEAGWALTRAMPPGPDPQIVLVFGSTDALRRQDALDALGALYPRSRRFGCSTAGEIHDTAVRDDSLAATAIRFEHTHVRVASVAIEAEAGSVEAGRRLGAQFEPDGLRHMFVLSDGLTVNGSDLLRGLTEVLPSSVAISGGLAGDGWRFGTTLVLLDDGPAAPQRVAALGLYGERLHIGYASVGGWSTFGPDRLITRSAGNILYELDGRPALDLYRTYLGPHAPDLPSSGLLFPLSVRNERSETGVVRTLLGIDEASGSMTFAGDMPEGAYARLMKTNIDSLIDGASQAADVCAGSMNGSPPELAVLISCAGRKMVLRQRTEEEVEAVRERLGPGAALAGFYSYGEMSPFCASGRCELHNQTMTITTFAER